MVEWITPALRGHYRPIAASTRASTPLAERAGVSLITVKRLEAADETLRSRYDTVVKVQEALEAAGVVFLDGADGYSHGVHLRSGFSGG